MPQNFRLQERMDQAGLLQRELVDAVNDELEKAGERPSVGDRTVRTWLTGKSRWPHPAKRKALTAVFGCTVEDLGFVPPSPAPQQEDDVIRRRFLGDAAGAALAPAIAHLPATPPPAAKRRIGTPDVERLAVRLTGLVADDDRHGGTLALEEKAAALTNEALNLQQQGTASQRVRGMLYGTAATFVSSAMWAAIDGRRLDNAVRHLNHAVTLAGLSGDPAVQFRIWGHAGALYRQQGRYADAMAASEAARHTGLMRKDPMYASLWHARMAVDHADHRDATSVQRSIHHARDALQRAEVDAPRPPWMAFYDAAELELLALIAHHALGDWETAEAHAHRHLALVRPHLVRNRVLANAYLAHAQLGQDELGQALDTATSIPLEARQGRIGRLLASFGNRLQERAPGSTEARAWADHTHTARSMHA